MRDRALVEMFATQVETALSVLRDIDATYDRVAREISDLEGAGQILDDSKILDTIAKLSSMSTEDAVIVLTTMLGELRPPMAKRERPKETPNNAELTTETGKSDSPGDSSPTQVKKRNSNRSRRFDTGEHIALVNFFREEASESLDRMVQLILTTSSSKPSDEILNELMRLTHGLKGSAGTIELPDIASLAHEYESAVTKIHHGSWQWSTTMRDRLVEAADGLRSTVDDALNPDSSETLATEWIRRLRHLGEQVLENGNSPSLIVTERVSSDSYSERRRPDRRGLESPTLRVDPTRIDRLMNCVGELVFDRTRIEKGVRQLESQLEGIQKALAQLAHEQKHRTSQLSIDEISALLCNLESAIHHSLPQLSGSIESLKRDTALLRKTEFALQDGLTSVRMQSVRKLFQRLTPQLRSIASQANKQVRLITSGGETEFDKVVADKLVEPIIQLLRNAVAHAIESPEIRAERGKSPEGRIHITARHEGNVVILEVSDDGNGVDVFELRERFVQAGNWTQDQADRASDAMVLDQIFESGFSSASEVDQLAGRGVGLSLVRETVARLGGEVLVTSIPARGTTFSMRLPLTTAIVNAMLFKVGGHVFAIPNVHVLSQSSVAYPLNSKVVDADGNSLPLLVLHEILGFGFPDKRNDCPLVFLEYLGKRLAISCDKIVGPREIVLQHLGPMLRGIPLYAGGTVSPSGKVQLILDPAALAQLAFPQDELAPHHIGGSDGVAQRVLVVDDSKAIREAMRRMLTRAGYEVITAADGLSAWHSLLEHRCDLLVTDLEMPGESGFELLERLQADVRYQDLPTLVISSKADEPNQLRARALGVSSILPKPVGQSQLIDALRDAKKSPPLGS